MSKEIVFISGASRGIGTAIAEHFANKGHKVIGTSRNNFTFDSDNTNLIPLSLDITNRDSVNECMDYLKENNLTPSILINNAGITSDQLFLRMKDEDWDNVIATNLTGTFNLTKALIKGMIKSRYGRIINISSVSGLMGNPGQVNYSSAKAVEMRLKNMNIYAKAMLALCSTLEGLKMFVKFKKLPSKKRV